MAIIVSSPALKREDEKLIISFAVGKESEADARKLYLEHKHASLPLDLTLKRHRKRRSLDANAFMWSLCQGVAEALRTTREEIYRDHIRKYGVFYTAKVKASEAEQMISAWESNGIGWIAEKMDNYDGTYIVFLFPGSSTYDTAQMSRLIDSLVTECDELGLDCQLTPAERALIYE